MTNPETLRQEIEGLIIAHYDDLDWDATSKDGQRYIWHKQSAAGNLTNDLLALISKTPIDAARAYNQKAKELFGESAYLNPILNDQL